MRVPSSRAIGLTAGVLMLVGLVSTAVFAVLQSRCDGTVSQPGVTTLVPHLAKCSAYGWGAGIGLGVLAIGAALVALAGLVSTQLFRRGPREPREPRHPPADDPPEGQSAP